MRKLLSYIGMIVGLVACTSIPSHTEVNTMLSAAIAMEDSNAVLALDIYEEVLDRLHDNPDSTLQSETLFRMGLLFMGWGLHEECLEMMTAAYRIDSARQDSFKMSKCLRSIALAFESRGLLHDALYYSTKAREISSTNNHRFLKQRIDEDTIRYGLMTRMQEALPTNYASELNHLTPKSSELELLYNGWMAEQDGRIKDAISHYSHLWRTHSYYVQAFAQIRLASLYLATGNHSSAEYAINEFSEINSIIRQSEQTSRELIQHHARYQDRRSMQEIGRLSLQNRWQLLGLIVTIGVSLLLVILMLLMVRIYRQRQVILRFRIDKLRQWRQEYLQRSDTEHHLTEEQGYQTDIYQQLRLKLNGGDKLLMSPSEWDALEQAVLTTYPLFRQRLYELCHLSDHEYHVCLLLKMKFKPSDIARLTIHSNEAISSTRRRLYQRVFGKKGSPSEWDEMIKTL